MTARTGDTHAADPSLRQPLAQIVNQRLVRRLLDSAGVTLVAGLLTGVVVYIALTKTTGDEGFLTWLVALAVVTGVRMLALPFLGRRLTAQPLRGAGLWYALFAFAGGATWAWLVTFDNPGYPIGARLLILIAMVAMPAASLTSNAVVRPVYYAFSIPVFAAMLYWAWWHNVELQIEFSVIGVVYMVLISTVANRFHENLRRSIERDIENERLLSEVGMMNSELQRMAYQDPLTGLANRRSFEQTAAQLLQRLRGDDVLALMLIDMDDFKRINDSLGHAAGDQALITLSRRIDDNSRITEIVAHAPIGAARIGGDEFTVLYRLERVADVEHLAARILDVAIEPMNLNGQEYVPSISIGIALAPSHADNLDDLLHLADHAMYKAKSRGGSSFVVAEPPAQEHSAKSTAGTDGCASA